MATIVIEDGTFPAGANSYVTEAEATTYHADRGNTDWKSAKTKAKQEALVRAAYALETLYAGKWLGVKTQSWIASDGTAATPVQQLAWPRVETPSEDPADAVVLKDVDGIPIAALEIPAAVKTAQMELALIELSQRVVGNALDQEDAVKRVTVDVITKEFFEKAPSAPSWPHIDMILSGLVPAGGAFSGVKITLGLTDKERNQGGSTWEDYFADSRYFN